MNWKDHWKNLPRVDLAEMDGSGLQDAIDSLPLGGCITLPPGRIAVNQTLRLSSGIWLRGSGPDETTLWLDDHSDCHILTNESQRAGNTYIALSDIRLAGNYSKQRRPENTKALIYSCGLYLKNTSHAHIENVAASDIRQTGLHFSECSSVRVSDYAANGVGWSGISTSGTDDIVIRRCTVKDAGIGGMHSGIHLDGGVGSVVEAEVRNVTGNAIMLDSTFCPLKHAVVLSKCSNSTRGVSLNGGAEHPLEYIYISGNFSDNREVGVMISNADGVVLTKSEIRRNTEYGLLLQGRRGGRNCIISENRFVGNGAAVGEIHESGSNYFVDNVEEGNRSANLLRLPARTTKRAKLTTRRSRKTSMSPSDQHSYSGTCSVCGSYERFSAEGKAIREGYHCPSCNSSLRHRGQAEAILRYFAEPEVGSFQNLVLQPHFRKLAIYEPALRGPYHKYLEKVPGYQRSYYWEDVRPGDERRGIICQDLTNLTFANDSFHLIITSEVFEHIRKPYEAFREIHRVLKPGGMHIFSIPLGYPMPRETIFRVDTAGEEDIFTLPPRYHAAGDGSRSLVYTDFGEDMLGRLSDIGLPTEALHVEAEDARLKRVLTFASRKHQGAKSRTAAAKRSKRSRRTGS